MYKSSFTAIALALSLSACGGGDVRASAVRSAIITAIEAATLDTKARAGDVIRVLRTARIGEYAETPTR